MLQWRGSLENQPLNRMEEMLGTLIKMVGENNSRLKSVEEKTDRLKIDKLDSDMQEL